MNFRDIFEMMWKEKRVDRQSQQRPSLRRVKSAPNQELRLRSGPSRSMLAGTSPPLLTSQVRLFDSRLLTSFFLPFTFWRQPLVLSSSDGYGTWTSNFRNLVSIRWSFDWHTDTSSYQDCIRSSFRNICHGSVKTWTCTRTPIASRSFIVVYQCYFNVSKHIINTSAR